MNFQMLIPFLILGAITAIVLLILLSKILVNVSAREIAIKEQALYRAKNAPRSRGRRQKVKLVFKRMF